MGIEITQKSTKERNVTTRTSIQYQTCFLDATTRLTQKHLYPNRITKVREVYLADYEAYELHLSTDFNHQTACFGWSKTVFFWNGTSEPGSSW